MPRARSKYATAPMPRRSFTPNEYADRQVGKMPYRLQQLRESSGGWKTLAGFWKLDPALEAGPLRGGHVRVVAGKESRVVISWRNGRVLQELDNRDSGNGKAASR